jgi:predicted flap endonuclease-1-like 5' DNA nuclease
MRHGWMRGWILAVTSALALWSARPALASHYAVGDIPSLISAGDAEKLKKGGISTTEELFAHAASSQDRKALAKKAGLTSSSLLALAKRCDLLRVRGVGPEMVLLLEAAGIHTTAELARQDPAALTTAANAANKIQKISEKPPTEPQFQDWIAQAKRLPQTMESR